jgi:hypothetical protein
MAFTDPVKYTFFLGNDHLGHFRIDALGGEGWLGLGCNQQHKKRPQPLTARASKHEVD